MRPTHALFLPAVLAAGALAGCDGGPQTETQRQQAMEDYAASFGVDVDVSANADGSETVAVNTGLGGVGGSNLALPDGFPDDVPVYPAINIFATGALGQGHMIQGQAPDGLAAVTDFYMTRMAADGWTNESDAQALPGMRMLQFAKDGRAATINLIENDPGTTVQMTVTGG